MKIVLATPAAEKETGNVGYMPPMNLAYLGGSVKHFDDITVSVVDGNGEGLNTENAADRIIQGDPDIVGISVTSADIRRALMLLTLIKAAKPGVVAIFGGHHATAFDQLLLEQVPFLDLALRGEADHSFPTLCQLLQRGEDISQVPGLSYRRNGRVKRGVPQIIEDLDSIPFPDRSLFEEGLYWLGGIGIRLKGQLPARLAAIVTSRGCPHGCTFCSKLTPRHGEYRSRSVENILQELLELKALGYQMVVFLDENFSREVNRVTKLCELIQAHNLQMRYMFQGTVHNLSQPVLNFMQEVGFDMVAVGVESGSDAQLKRFRKTASSLLIAEGIRRAKQAHMFVHGCFITGGPGETMEDHEATLKFVRDVRPHTCTIYELVVYPGTPVWEDLLGHSPEKTVGDTRCRPIHAFAGCADKAVIDRQIKKFWRTFALSWLRGKRFRENVGLWRHNPSARFMLRRGFKRFFEIFYQLFRGVQKSV